MNKRTNSLLWPQAELTRLYDANKDGWLDRKELTSAAIDTFDSYVAEARLGLINDNTLRALSQLDLVKARSDFEVFRKTALNTVCGVDVLDDNLLSALTDVAHTTALYAREVRDHPGTGREKLNAARDLIRRKTDVEEEWIGELGKPLPECAAHPSNFKAK